MPGTALSNITACARCGRKSNSIPVSSEDGKNDGNNDGKSRPLSLPAWCWEGFTGVDVWGSRWAAASEIAATHFHTSNHNGIVSIRFGF